MSAAASFGRVTLEVAAHDAERAAALLSAASGVAAAAEQREGSDTASVSVYMAPAVTASTVRRVHAALHALQKDDELRHAPLTGGRVRRREWATVWRAFFKTHLLAPRMYVVPPWERAAKGRNGDTLVIEPGMAFGTGLHATTKLAARLLLQHVRSGDIVIDAGCGSGILALAAARRGARVYAYDADADAIDAAMRNFAANRVKAERITRATRVPARFPNAHVIVANIDLPTLSAHARDLRAALARGGVLVTSGVTARGRLEVLACFAGAGLEFISEHRLGEWFAYVHVRS
ncbi:MAG: 50S ribosomal protein L11 methyltransferase [Candidatus Eremiobacteraeota bacterium]|nr:50S ribosomal protein L11 methyltransferase [Candidatus Eremiobacteraeota bacterium]